MTAPPATAQSATPPAAATPQPAPRLTLPALEGLPVTQSAPQQRPPAIPPAVPTAQPNTASSADSVPVNPAAAAQAAAETEARRAAAAPAPAARAQASQQPVERRAAAAPAREPAQAPADAEPLSAEVATPAPAILEAAPATSPVEAPAETVPADAQAEAGDRSLLLWGGAGLLVLGGIGLAFALRRGRKARDAEPVLAPSAPLTESRRVDAPEATPVVASAPVEAMPLPEGIGRHEAAALRGPTPDNPFVTRRARLRRAHFYDYHERLAAGRGRTPAEVAAPAPAARAHPAEVASPAASMSDRVRGKVRSIADAASWQVGAPMKPSYSG